VDSEIVAPVVSTAFRDLAPNYVVREVFARSATTFRTKSAKTITDRLGSDGHRRERGLLRDVHLPADMRRVSKAAAEGKESERMELKPRSARSKVRIANSMRKPPRRSN